MARARWAVVAAHLLLGLEQLPWLAWVAGLVTRREALLATLALAAGLLALGLLVPLVVRGRAPLAQEPLAWPAEWPEELREEPALPRELRPVVVDLQEVAATSAAALEARTARVAAAYRRMEALAVWQWAATRAKAAGRPAPPWPEPPA